MTAPRKNYSVRVEKKKASVLQLELMCKGDFTGIAHTQNKSDTFMELSFQRLDFEHKRKQKQSAGEIN